LEVGIAAMGAAEIDTIRAITHAGLRARTMVWSRMLQFDLRTAAECGADVVHLSVPVSDQQLHNKLRRDRAWALATVQRCVSDARDAGLVPSVGLEDASRADDDFLAQVAETAQMAGAIRLRFADTLGLLDPFSTHARIRALRAATDLDIEMHAHNDLGLATANTLAALRAGATHASTTVNGLGERAGNAALEEVVMGLRHLYGIECGVDTRALVGLSQRVATASGRPVPAGKCIVGEAVFSHESGIHVDGLLKDPRNYQPFDPAELGRSHSLVLGKHSGSAALRRELQRLQVQVCDEVLDALLARVREHATQTKRQLDGADLRHLISEVVSTPPPHFA
jgi:homocitrate synthase NifV